jgi:hypothetical protein
MCVKRFSANSASNKIHRCYFVPFSPEQRFKFYSMLGTDPPAVAAACTEAHIMKKFSLVSLIRMTEGARRAILNAGKTAVALLVYTKKTHNRPLFSLFIIA